MDFTSAAFWAALGSIIWVNFLLSGDNAVVIAMAARTLPPQRQGQAIFWGSAAAIVLRILLTVIAAQILKWPFLKVVGALLLLYVGISLLGGSDDGEGELARAPDGSLLAAIRTILLADLVMSLDNVLAVAAAAKGDIALLVIGLAISVPLIIFGSTLLLKVMGRFPSIVTAGAALLGWLAGEMLLTDPGLARLLGQPSTAVLYIARSIGVAMVLAPGMLLQRRAKAQAATDA